MSQQQTNNQTHLTRQGDTWFYSGSCLSFRITGLTGYNLDRLKVTLKVNPLENTSDFHIDTVDLYSSKSREVFSENCQKYLKTKPSHCLSDLNMLINLLENERVNLQKSSDKTDVPKMTKEDEKEALEVLKSKSLIERIVTDFDAIGLIGERHNKLLGYIASVSRLLPDPLGVLVLSRSGAGKTSLQDAICKFVPPESAIQYTRLTGQSLFYRNEDALKNKVLAIEEEEGMQDAMYSIRTLQSSQKLSVASTRTDSKTGKLSVDEYTVYGPVVVMISTTNPDALDPETKQRFLILTIDESETQTKNILHQQRLKNKKSYIEMTMDVKSITSLHHNMQRLLKPLNPVFPDNLEIEYPYKRLQMRREQGKYISLIKAITLLHQHQRKKGTLKRLDDTPVNFVEVSKDDVRLALELGRLVFHRNIDDVSPTGRTLLGHISKLVADKKCSLQALCPDKEIDIMEVTFTRKELREYCGWSEAQIRQNICPLVELGYLGQLKGSWGSTYRYVLLDDGQNDPKLGL